MYVDKKKETEITQYENKTEKLDKSTDIEMNNFHQPTNPIERSPFGRLNIPLTANVLENFQQLPLTNPVRSLRFNEPIHMAVSEHLGQSHVSPFNNFQIQGPSVPKNFYFQFFIGLLAAARLEPGNKITAAYTRQYENLLQILVTYGETEMHSHSIFYGKLNVDNSPEIALERELQPLSRHINDLDGTNIKTIESHVYDLVPHRPSSEISDERVGMQMNLRQKKKISTKGDFSPHGANIADFTSQPKRDELSYFFDQIRLTTSEPDVADLNMLAQNALLQVPRSETPGNGYIAGYLHGLMFSALPDKYYHRVLTANFPSIRFDPVGMQVYFPATVQRPDEHLLIDSDPYDINRHNGYDVFDQLTNVNHETQITETRLVVSENRFDPLSSTLLQWNIENLAQNLHTDIVFSTPSDAQDLKENIEYYSGVVKKMLNRKSIRCNLHSLEDVRAFLIGTFRAELKKNVKISKSNEKVVDALLVEKEFQFGPAPDLLTTFGVDQNIIQPIDTLITTHKSHHILGMNFQFDNGQISFQPFSMTADEAANRFAFAELPKFNLIPSLEEINRVSDKPLFATSDEETQARQMLHENMQHMKNIDKKSEYFEKSPNGKVTDGMTQRLEILNDVAKVCHYAGQALMVRDLVSDVYNVDYVKNPNDTSAELNMAVDGAFLAIDLITLGIEGLASAGLISGSIAAMANPIGAALGMALIIGLNVYQVVKTIENIQKFVTLNDQELLMYHVVRNAGFETIATDVMEDQLDGQIRGHSYMCHNSFGLQLKNSTPGKAAYFDLGDGHDMISGFIDKSNLFHLGNGRKYIKGGEGNDIFFLEGAHATGYLNGSSGEDTVDMSGMNTPEFVLLSSGNDVVYSNGLNLIDIETVVGRFNIHETVICGCSLRTVRTLGGRRDEPDLIVAKDHDCNYETTLYLDDNTNVSINQVQGNFKHVVNMKQRSEKK
uniref:Uncharacterized protein n=1 Tax=Romanomermis culicivorax TaxID=13658 RepID=A0A915IUB6_ROMCU